MKKIEPISTWYNGKLENATLLNVYVVNDNLSTSANFAFQLIKNSESDLTNGLTILSSGILDMNGEDYSNWQTNEYAYNWIAKQLNLTIID